MENEKKYLQKVLIYVEETLIGAYRPTIDKNSCQLNSLESFQTIDINNVLINNTTKDSIIFKSNTLLKMPKCRKKNKHQIKLDNVELKLMKNKKYEEYMLFVTQESISTNTVCLEMLEKDHKFKESLKTTPPSENVVKDCKKYKKSRIQPRNYKKLVGFDKIFEEMIRHKLLSALQTYETDVAASAIFKTNNKNNYKLFLTHEINTEKDINIFIKKLNDMNTCQKKIINPNLNVQNVRAFIVLNENKKELYLELTDDIRKDLIKPLQISQIIKYDSKKFINANLLNVKLHNLKLYSSSKKLQKVRNLHVQDSENSDLSLDSNTNSLISINEFSFHNIYDMMKQYEENVTSNFDISAGTSCDSIIKDTYKMLVELQLNAIEQCNKLYLNYFNNKDRWPKENKTKFVETMKSNYGLLVKLQNKAIENSVFVNKKIKNVNKFINKITNKTNIRQCCSHSHLRHKPSITNYNHMSSTNIITYPNLTSISDYKTNKKLSKKEIKIHVSVGQSDQKNSQTYLSSDVSQCTSMITIEHETNCDKLHEIEVQTSLRDIHHTMEKIIKINKCCSPMNVTESMDKKCVQTDISVNKNTSIDFGGQRVQICKRNINLKMRHTTQTPQTTIKVKLEEEISRNVENTKKLQKEILISPSEREILSQLSNPKLHRRNDKEETLTSANNLKIQRQDKDETLTDASSLETQESCDKEETLTDKNNLKTEDLVSLDNFKEDIPPQNNEISSTNSYENLSTDDEELELFTSDLEEKMEKLSDILKKIQNESKPSTDDLLFVSSSKKLSTIPEEPKEEPKVEPKKHEFLFHIKNTLERVKERFHKNTLILKKVTDLKDNYMVTTNMQKLIETSGMTQGEFPGKPKFLKLPVVEVNSFSSSSTLKCVKQAKDEITKNLHTSLQLLKNLNEVTKNIKNNPETSMVNLNEIEASIQFQKKLTPKYRYEKSHLTLAPIKNFINSNKMKVSNNTRGVKSKKPRIMPTINSTHILDLSNSRSNKRRRTRCTRISTTSIKIQKCPTAHSSLHPSVLTSRETPLIPKIYRPISPKNYQHDTTKLSNLTLSDVAPFQPEYPRKDNLAHIEIEKTYLYKLLNNSFSEKSLEPLIKCSNVNCISCTTMSNSKKSEKGMKKRREYFPKADKTEKTPSKMCVWEKMHWNTEITIQQDHDFDFKQYMDDPNLNVAQDVTVCPVNVNFEKAAAQSVEVNGKDVQISKKGGTAVAAAQKVAANKSGNSQEITPPGTKNAINARANQNKIQKSIQQAILKNQEKFKIIEQSLAPKRAQNPPKFKKVTPPKTPKIISSGTLNNKKILWTKLSPQFSKRNEMFVRRQQNILASKEDNVFDRKYKENMSIISSRSQSRSSDTANINGCILTQISQTVKKSQDDMQKYIELVEQKFLKTFSMPETEKATAYTNLESEIKDMLHLLNTSKDKKMELAETNSQISKTKAGSRPASDKIMKKSSSDKSKMSKSPSLGSKTSSRSSNTPTKSKKLHELSKKREKGSNKSSNRSSNVSVIVIKEPNKTNFTSGSEVAMLEANKKKAPEKPGPTICTDSINFLESFTAIVSKQNLMFPSFFQTEPKKSASILKSANNDNFKLKASVSNKSVNKKVRFQLDDMKVTRSESSVTMSTDEEYSTLYEETASEFSSSDQEIQQIIRLHLDYSLLVNLKITFYVEHPTIIPDIYYVSRTYQQISLKDIEFMPENYDVKIICSKEFDTFALPPVSNFKSDLEPTEIVYQSDSLSDFIENCEEIIEATRKLELDRKQSSPDILEFLDLLTSISIEHLGLKKELNYQLTLFNSFPYYVPCIYFTSNIFHPIFYKNNDEFEIISKYELQTDELGTIIPKNNKFIPFDNIDTIAKSINSSKIIPFQNMQLQKYFSQPEFSNEFLKYHIKIPFSEELDKCQSDTNFLDVLTYKSRQRYETIYQTLVLNLQVQNCGHRKNLNKNARKTIRKKCYIAPTKNKLQLKAIEVDFGFNTNKLLSVQTTYKRLLICLYIILFSFAFLCITLNYKCE